MGWFWGWRRNIPTERKILATLYDMYEGDFPRVDGKNNEAWIDIDIDEAAAALHVTPEFLHGYLSYMELKYRFKTAENCYRSLYVFRGERRCGISLPIAAAILAGHTEEAWKHRLTLGLSLGALLISIASVGVDFLSFEEKIAARVSASEPGRGAPPAKGHGRDDAARSIPGTAQPVAPPQIASPSTISVPSGSK